jgi:uncharacterized protein (TIGR00369 family)
MPEPNAMFPEMPPEKPAEKPAQDPRDPSAARGWKRDYCFGCGPANPQGLQLRFEPGPAGDSYVAEFELSAEFGGPPGHAHGGIVATILDEAMSKANKLRGRLALTRRIEVDYLRPVPLARPLVVEGRIGSVRGRASYNRAEIRNSEGVVLARSSGKFLVVDAEKMFARELEKERREAERRQNSPTQAKKA